MPRNDIFGHRPNERGNRRGHGGGHERVGGDAIRGYRGAGVKTVPTDPEHASADHTKNHAMRRHRFFAETNALAEDHAEDQCGPSGRHMHHRAASEVDRFNLGVRVPDAIHEPIHAPDHVGEREINDEHPEGHKKQRWRKTSCARR